MNAHPAHAPPRLRKRLLLVTGAVAALFALLIGFNTFKGIMMGKALQAMASPPQTVSAMTAGYQDWQPKIEAVGNIRAVRGTDLAFDAAGLVAKVRVKSGADVREGDVLISLIDTDDRATLEALEATARLAALTVERSRGQLAVQAISQAQYDSDLADQQGARARANAQAALVARKTLRAPFAGRIGIITVSPGQYISTGTAVATLQQLDPVYVDFTVPQRSLELMRPGSQVGVRSDAYPERTFTGRISATDPRIDLATRNVRVEALIHNPGNLLVPGMFTRVAVESGQERRYLTLPQTAVAYAPYGDTVFVVHEGVPPGRGDNAGSATAQRPPAPGGTTQRADRPLYVQQVVVKLGSTRGDQVAILSGIHAGDLVVTSGQLKLKNDTPVRISDQVQPSFSADPRPVEQ